MWNFPGEGSRFLALEFPRDLAQFCGSNKIEKLQERGAGGAGGRGGFQKSMSSTEVYHQRFRVNRLLVFIGGRRVNRSS